MDYEALYKELQFDFDEKNKEHTERYVHLMKNHIQLEKENEELKKDNKQFEEKQETWWDVFEKLRTFGMTRKDEISELKKENEKLKKEHDLCWNKMWKLKEQLDAADGYCEQWGYKWDEEEEVYVNEDDDLTDTEDESEDESEDKKFRIVKTVDPEKPWMMTLKREPL
jgi:cell division protein FtsB